MRFRAELELSNVNMRVERAGDAKEGAVDCKFTGQLDAGALKGLLPTEAAFIKLVSDFYRDDDELVTPHLGAVSLNLEGIGVKANIKSAMGQKVAFAERCNFNSFKYTLQAGRLIDFSCRLQAHPDQEQVGVLFELQQQGVTLEVSWREGAMAAREDDAQKDLALKGGEGGVSTDEEDLPEGKKKQKPRKELQ